MLDYMNLLANYNKKIHEEGTSTAKKNLIKINYFFSKKWINEEQIPYVAKTHLLDSYYCLPNRPDMAFTFLWKSFNNTYSELWLKGNPTDKGQLQDGKSLNYFIEEISKNLNIKINDEQTIKNLIELYISGIPMKITKFIATFLLKNYVIEKTFQPTPENTIGTKHISTTYTTFKSHFKTIHKAIIETYGEAYLKITAPKINHNAVEMNISEKNSEKSRKIIAALANDIKKLLVERKIKLSNSDKTKSYEINLHNDKDYINFITRNILYSIRNHTVHGKIAARLNSKTKNSNSYFSTVYIYLLGYTFLALSFYQLGYAEAEDLNILYLNYEDNIKSHKS